VCVCVCVCMSKGLRIKLKAAGINGQLLKWFENYKSDRKQRVLISGVQSEWANIVAGNPQGSILSSLLVLEWNDLSEELLPNSYHLLF